MKETQFWGYGSVAADCSLAPTVAATTAEGGTLTRELPIFGNILAFVFVNPPWDELLIHAHNVSFVPW